MPLAVLARSEEPYTRVRRFNNHLLNEIPHHHLDSHITLSAWVAMGRVAWTFRVGSLRRHISHVDLQLAKTS